MTEFLPHDRGGVHGSGRSCGVIPKRLDERRCFSGVTSAVSTISVEASGFDEELPLRLVGLGNWRMPLSRSSSETKTFSRRNMPRFHGLNVQLKAQWIDWSVSRGQNAILSTSTSVRWMGPHSEALGRRVASRPERRYSWWMRRKQILAMAHAGGRAPEEIEEASPMKCRLHAGEHHRPGGPHRGAGSGKTTWPVHPSTGKSTYQEIPANGLCAPPLRVRGKVVGVLVGDHRKGGGQTLPRNGTSSSASPTRLLSPSKS